MQLSCVPPWLRPRPLLSLDLGLRSVWLFDRGVFLQESLPFPLSELVMARWLWRSLPAHVKVLLRRGIRVFFFYLSFE